MTNSSQINTYLYTMLQNRLYEYGVKKEMIEVIIEDIETKMLSLLYHWRDCRFRDTILFTTLEEAEYYEPNANIKVKSFVVACIRNSKVEHLASDNSCLMFGLSKPLNDIQIKAITMEAITYFGNINFDKLSREIVNDVKYDIYNEIAKLYPTAWNVLQEVANCVARKKSFDSFKTEGKLIDSEITSDNLIKLKKVKIYQ